MRLDGQWSATSRSSAKAATGGLNGWQEVDETGDQTNSQANGSLARPVHSPVGARPRPVGRPLQTSVTHSYGWEQHDSWIASTRRARATGSRAPHSVDRERC